MISRQSSPVQRNVDFPKDPTAWCHVLLDGELVVTVNAMQVEALA